MSTTILGDYLYTLGNYPSSLSSVISSQTEKLADYVRRVRREKGLSTSDVQQRSGGGISDAYITRIENEQSLNISVSKLQALARGLGVSEDEIFAVARGTPLKHQRTVKEAMLVDYFNSLPVDRQDDLLKYAVMLVQHHGKESKAKKRA